VWMPLPPSSCRVYGPPSLAPCPPMVSAGPRSSLMPPLPSRYHDTGRPRVLGSAGQVGRQSPSVESTLSALSPAPLPPFDFAPPPLGRIQSLPQQAPATPPRGVHDFLQEFRVPVTPGSSPGPHRRAPLDIAGFVPGPMSASPATSSGQWPWDEFSQSSPMPSGSVVAETHPPLAWHHVVDVVYNSGLVDLAHLPVTPAPTQSVIGGPVVPPKRRVALPPAPLALASVDNAVRACWGVIGQLQRSISLPLPMLHFTPIPPYWSLGSNPGFTRVPVWT